jgi:hypothetical protein
MLCQVKIYRNAKTDLNPSTGQIVSSQGPVLYLGKARIWGADGAGAIPVGEGDFSTRATYCSIPVLHTPVPRNDDTILVVSCPYDQDLVGRSFRITSVDGGGMLSATRKMQIIGFYENRTWRPE